MPISISKIRAALERMNQFDILKKAKIEEDRALTQKIINLFPAIIEYIKRIPGEKGDKGDPGKTPVKGIDYFDGEKGDPGIQGKDGRDGIDGSDAIANLAEIHTITACEIGIHEKVFDHRLLHDSKIIGSKTVNEKNIGEGKILVVRGEHLAYEKMPQSKVVQQPYRSGVETHRRYRIKTITSSVTIDPLDDVIHVDCTSGAITITFYPASGNEGNHLFIKKIDSTSNQVTFTMNGTETIDTDTLYKLVNLGSGAEVYNDGSNWWIKHS